MFDIFCPEQQKVLVCGEQKQIAFLKKKVSMRAINNEGQSPLRKHILKYPLLGARARKHNMGPILQNANIKSCFFKTA